MAVDHERSLKVCQSMIRVRKVQYIISILTFGPKKANSRHIGSV